ncbi:alpha,alpha-trehalose-phosphate synthase (UDP-forming) [Maricaulis maris]|uniref:Trehalose 6-phosphate synthase n=1 Tax=Maricaulis maris TaxID=74318 RepID=A0A495DCQ7_9PROT|nr:trehalose-6-phosphate synthase [Maricaulis maris]RKR00069.1 trehalose 6-phosphate synthase [Maricaulis maris]
MGRLIAISNRTAADPKARAGGLAVAVWESLKETGGSWFGWSGELVDEIPRGTSVYRDEGVEFVLTDLTHDEHEGFYLNYANRVIWPVFHYRIDLACFDSDAFQAYSAVNQRLANMVADRLVPTDTVWVHDYHFLLMGDALRHAGWEGPTGFFLHIPFPPPEIFRAIPEHHWIARALCAYSVIGFQCSRDRSNFVRYLVDDCGGKELGDGRISVFGTTTRIEAYPIGIDPAGFIAAAHSAVADRAAERISRFLGGRELVIGVDRMDYSKGLPQRFEAVGQLFDDHPEMHGKVSVTQIAPPSRSKVEEYQELRLELDQLAGRINGDHGDLDWIPLRYLARSYTREELAGLFRIARVGLVTPLRDGMNLVAKEFVIAQDESDPGVLVLSQFAGAAEQMKDALIVNPHDRNKVADAIHQALTMSLEERQERWRKLRDVVVAQDIAWWRNRFLEDLKPAVPA